MMKENPLWVVDLPFVNLSLKKTFLFMYFSYSCDQKESEARFRSSFLMNNQYSIP